MHIVPFEHQFSQAQAAECTSADAKTVENYINYSYIRPLLIEGRRRFSLRHLLKIEFTHRLATVCKIAPKSGSGLAERILAQGEFGLEQDAEAISLSEAWAYGRAAGDRLNLIFDPNSPEDVKFVVTPNSPAEAIHLMFPARTFSRMVMQKAAVALGLTD